MNKRGFNADDPRLSAYLMDELDAVETEVIERLLRIDPEARDFVEQLKRTAELLEQEFQAEPAPGLSSSQRSSVERRSAGARRAWVLKGAAAALVLLAVGGTLLVKLRPEDEPAFRYSLFSSAGRPAARSALPAPGERFGRPPQVTRRQLRNLGYLGSDAVEEEVEPGAIIADFITEPKLDTEQYAWVAENPWKLAGQEPLSTFSVDVDTAAYSNMRRFLREGRLPPAASVRAEEFLNYFRYDDPAPDGQQPFRVTTEVASAPWQPRHRLLRIGIQARKIEWSRRKPTNLVFLLDVSGSMDSPDKLPLLQRSLRLLVEQLDQRDRVAIVVYAGASGLVLPSTSGRHSAEILGALDRLSAGGSTNGGAGIELAYTLARENFLEDGLNQVILATDGDFNVGATDQGSLVRLIETQRESGVFLSLLGFGTGNLNDSTMELLADKGNGNFAYIDSLAEAQKVLVSEVGGTLIPVAKDVKIQVEFNPTRVQAWRLIGYENRQLADQDFSDDTKDAGEIGAGHSVTALYEIVPPDVPFQVAAGDPLRYQQHGRASDQAFTDELLFLKLRYKQPEGDTSRLISTPVHDSGRLWHEAGDNFRFSAAVAAYALLLKGSPYLGDAFGYQQVIELAYEARGDDPGGYREEFLRLVGLARRIASGETPELLRALGYTGDDK